MANILTDDVRTYVSKLIEKELGSIIKVANMPAKYCKTDRKTISKAVKRSERRSPSEDTYGE